MRGVETGVAKGSLGPFPKTLRWHEIAAPPVAATTHPENGERDSDEQIESIRARLGSLAKDAPVQRATTFLAALPVCTRHTDPLKSLREYYGVHAASERLDDLVDGLRAYAGEGPAVDAAEHAIRSYTANTMDVLFAASGWDIWRKVDGSEFCTLARLYFAELLRLVLVEQRCPAALTPPPTPSPFSSTRHLENREGDPIARFAWEASEIVKSFSARWFNACARDQIPGRGSITWYLGHCLGKLDLEMEREKSDWQEPTGNPWRRRRAAPGPALSL